MSPLASISGSRERKSAAVTSPCVERMRDLESTGISRMSVDLAVRDPARAS
jgi:hypothetical protein